MKHIGLCAVVAAFATGAAFAAPQFETITSVDDYAAALTCAEKGYQYFAPLSKTTYACIRDFREAMLAADHMPVKKIATFIKARSKVPVKVLPDGRLLAR